MEVAQKELFGSVLVSIGTILAAVGNTPSTPIPENTRIGLDITGNTLQATGNSLEAEVHEEGSLKRLGKEIQAFGNVTVVAGLIETFKENTNLKLIITGNWIQALGGTVSAGEEIDSPTPNSPAKAISIVGNMLQATGNSLQALAGTYELKTNGDYSFLMALGSWIQAVGAVLSTLSILLFIEENKAGQNELLVYF